MKIHKLHFVESFRKGNFDELILNSNSLVQQHSGQCISEVMWCENKCGAWLERRFLANHMRNECHKRTVLCQFCSREFVQETLQVLTNQKL